MTNLFLNTPGSGSGGPIRPWTASSGRSDVAGEGSLPHSQEDNQARISVFSRLLAGKLNLGREIETPRERSHLREEPATRQDETNQTPADPPNSRGEESGPSGQDANQVADRKESSVSLLCAFENQTGAIDLMGGLPGLLQVNQTPGLFTGTIPDLMATSGVPDVLVTRLAAEISANYTNRGGLETLNFKLETDHLGHLDVRLQAKADHLSVRLLAADRESENALRENIKELSEAIQKRTGRFQHVEVRVEQKAAEDTGPKNADEDTGRPKDSEARGGPRDETGPDGGPDDQDNTELESQPGSRALGG